MLGCANLLGDAFGANQFLPNVVRTCSGFALARAIVLRYVEGPLTWLMLRLRWPMVVPERILRKLRVCSLSSFPGTGGGSDAIAQNTHVEGALELADNSIDTCRSRWRSAQIWPDMGPNSDFIREHI